MAALLRVRVSRDDGLRRGMAFEMADCWRRLSGSRIGIRVALRGRKVGTWNVRLALLSDAVRLVEIGTVVDCLCVLVELVQSVVLLDCDVVELLAVVP